MPEDAPPRPEIADWPRAFASSDHPLAGCLGRAVALAAVAEADAAVAAQSGGQRYLYSRSTHGFLRDAAGLGTADPAFAAAGFARILGIDTLLSALMVRLTGGPRGSYGFERGLQGSALARLPAGKPASPPGAAVDAAAVALAPEAVEALALAAHLAAGGGAPVDLDLFVFSLLITAGRHAALLVASLDPPGGAFDARALRAALLAGLMAAADGPEVIERTRGRSAELQDWLIQSAAADWPALPRPAEAPDYRADRPISRPEDDLLGVRNQARAAAELVCLRDSGTLAIGVFGDWGSGKSSLLRLLEGEIAALTDAVRALPGPEGTATGTPASPFLAEVATVSFDVWQYNDAQLMLALANRTFATLGNEQVEARIAAEMAGALAGWQSAGAGARLARDEAEAERAATLRQIADTHASAGSDAAAARQAALDAFRQELGPAVARAGAARGFADELLAEAADGPVPVRPAALLTDLRLLTTAPVRLWLGLALLLALAGGAIWLLSLPRIAGVLAVAAAIVLPFLRQAQVLARILGDYTRARASADRARADRIAGLEARRQALDAEIAESGRRLAAAGAKLDRYGPAGRDQRYDFFLSESSVVRQLAAEAGPTARVRQAFEILDRMISEKRAAGAAAAGPGARLPDRVVFQIDELDRCRADQVVRMLEAIHLLLAFRNFAVVVAVDSRWLEGALLSVFERELTASGDRTVIVHEYIEKIIQVPIRVPGLSFALTDPAGQPEGSYVDLIRSLAPGEGPVGAGQAVGAGEAAGDGAGSAPGAPGAGAGTGTAGVPRIAPLAIAPSLPADPRAAARRAALTGPEIAGLAAMGRFVGSSPRTVKRFVNIYRLLRATRTGADFEAFVAGPPDRPGAPPLFGPVQLCLAVQCGMKGRAIRAFEGGIAAGLSGTAPPAAAFGPFLEFWPRPEERREAEAILVAAVDAVGYGGLDAAWQQTGRFGFWHDGA